MEERKPESGYVKYLLSHFLQDDHKGLLEDFEVKVIDKRQGSDPTKQEYYCIRTLKLCTQMV